MLSVSPDAEVRISIRDVRRRTVAVLLLQQLPATL